MTAWDRRIERASELAKTCAPAAEILRFYGEVARFQKTIYEAQPSDVLRYLPALRSLVKRVGPATLVESDDSGFFERCLLQPSYEYRAGQSDVARNVVRPDCPFCGEKPQVG
ncbi:MAG TPA: hypothetical protein VGG59_05270, partial [Acidobacteriaceae bacterium]